MAVTSIWRIKGAIGKVVLYVQNEDKTLSKETIDSDKKRLEESEVLDVVFDYVTRDSATEKQYYVSGFDCTAKDATEKMMGTKLEFGKLGGVTAYHGYQCATRS